MVCRRRDRRTAHPARPDWAAAAERPKARTGESEDSCRHAAAILQREPVTGPSAVSARDWTCRHHGGLLRRRAGTRLRYHRPARTAAPHLRSADRRRWVHKRCPRETPPRTLRTFPGHAPRSVERRLCRGFNPCSIAVIRGFAAAGSGFTSSKRCPRARRPRPPRACCRKRAVRRVPARTAEVSAGLSRHCRCTRTSRGRSVGRFPPLDGRQPRPFPGMRAVVPAPEALARAQSKLHQIDAARRFGLMCCHVSVAQSGRCQAD